MQGIVCMKYIASPGQAMPFSQRDLSALSFAFNLRRRFLTKLDVLCMGPPGAQEALQECYSYGADAVYLVTDPLFAGSDTLITTRILAKAIQHLSVAEGPCIVLCGDSTYDSGTGQVGPGLAYRLGYLFFPDIAELIMTDRGFKVQSDEYEADTDTAGKMVVSISDAAKLMFPTLHNILRARQAKVEILNNDQLVLGTDSVGGTASPTRVIRQTDIVGKKGQMKRCIENETAVEILKGYIDSYRGGCNG